MKKCRKDLGCPVVLLGGYSGKPETAPTNLTWVCRPDVEE